MWAFSDQLVPWVKEVFSFCCGDCHSLKITYAAQLNVRSFLSGCFQNCPFYLVILFFSFQFPNILCKLHAILQIGLIEWCLMAIVALFEAVARRTDVQFWILKWQSTKLDRKLACYFIKAIWGMGGSDT